DPVPKPDSTLARGRALPVGSDTQPSEALDFDLVELRPVLARDEQAPRVGVVGDAVQNGLARSGAARIQRREIDEAENFASRRRNARDSILVPDVRPDLAIDVLELVQARDRQVAVADRELAHDVERA